MVSSGMSELKVETFWGRAFIAALVVNNHCWSCVVESSRNQYVLRGTREGEEGPFNQSDPERAYHTALHYGSFRWVFDEGHMPCVWALSERVAQTLRVDELRVDIFVSKGDPHGCQLNELSISSGQPLGAYEMYAARI